MNNSGKFEDNLNVIGPILREKRKAKHMSFETLSSKLLLLGINIPITSLPRIENNQRTVRDYEICALAAILEIDLNDLLGPTTNRFKIS